MKKEEIFGMSAAYEHAKQCTYGANMSISATLVVDMAERIAELEKDIDHMTHALIEINDLAHTEGLLPEISLDRIKKRFSISSTKGE